MSYIGMGRCVSDGGQDVNDGSAHGDEPRSAGWHRNREPSCPPPGRNGNATWRCALMGGFRQFMFGAAVAPAQQLSPFLRFSGTGTVQVKPDTASISFNTNGQSSDKSAAVNEASAAMRHVITAMTSHGVGQKDLQTSADVYHDTTRGVYV